jgi:drug/metabolite transporter (DMT)-like permease
VVFLELLLGVFFGVISMMGFGAQDFVMARASRRIGAFKTSLWFMAVALGLMALLSIFLFTSIALTTTVLLVLLLASLLSLVGLLSFNKGLRVGNISVVATLGNVWGAVTAVLGIVLLGEKITLLQVFSITLIIIGTIMVSLKLRGMLRGSGHIGEGVEFAVITLFSWGIYYFLLGALVKDIGWFDTAFLTTLITVALFIVYGIATGSEMGIKRIDMPILFFIGLLSLFGFLAYNLGVSYNYTSIVAPISSASPIITILLALLLLKERLSTSQQAGIVLVLIGLIALSI